MNSETFIKKLQSIHACVEATEWAQSNNHNDRSAWDACERGDWLLWWAKEEGCDLRQITLAKARCAKLVVHLMKDERSIRAVEVAERFGLGQATHEELDEARRDAYAAYADDATPAAYAAYAAADDTAYAAYAGAAWREKRAEILKQCAGICRECITPTWIES